ncbi:GGDEF domain-containing protein [Granulicella tundricola]|uniref:diguanylate cyclase n=1 Tax=Granulicella tundricola (strain ATCC BAA-1859 / DSM 23138 / MP5ACTX9) TaxID=1198114 RepID=E8WZ77_GRATM|nr:GGDEF domain-containing protein [Granulicella tundricola]ADW67679.1 diguanylate cyclase [Granulicella tundricola MP5ACTX9]
MAAYNVLIFGALLLGCGSGGLFVVRLTNPRLKGLAWLGAAFSVGGVGALLLVFEHVLPRLLGILGADLMILLAFVLLHVSFLELVEAESFVPKMGILLLVIQGAMSFLSINGTVTGRVRVMMVGLLVAVQVSETARLLIRHGKRDMRAPAWFNIVILAFFAVLNLARSIGMAVGTVTGTFAEQVATLAYGIYIAVALGLAFGFFWMTTATLSAALEHIASTDPLTRLYNRRAFRYWCDKEVKRSQSRGRLFSVLMIDLDHFKKINDRFGHLAGDGALCAAVEKMQDSIRGIDILGRWGGEEFILLLPGASPDSALVIADRLRLNVAKIMVGATGELHRLEEILGDPNDMMRVTVSLGVTTYRGKGDTVESMLKRADEGLYEAKATGRNRIVAMT